jgi:hypothetical protein
VKFNAKTPRKEISCQGASISVIEPYVEGHQLNANEASVLNQTFAENIRNNCAPLVKKLLSEGADPATIQPKIDEYLATYEFGVRKGGGIRTGDPVRRQAIAIAKGKVKEALAKKGIKIRDIPAAELTKLADQAVEKHPQLLELARKQVEAQQQAAASISLDL